MVQFIIDEIVIFLKVALRKNVLPVRKHLAYQLPEGHFGPTKHNNVGTFEQIVGPNHPSGNC